MELNVVNGGNQVPIAPATPRAVLVVEPGARRLGHGHVGAARPRQGRPRAHACGGQRHVASSLSC